MHRSFALVLAVAIGAIGCGQEKKKNAPRVARRVGASR
jgi:hypothetical protein